MQSGSSTTAAAATAEIMRTAVPCSAFFASALPSAPSASFFSSFLPQTEMINEAATAAVSANSHRSSIAVITPTATSATDDTH